MSLIHERTSARNKISDDATGTELRHYCRNPRCRSKLPALVENEHHGFCTPGCHTSFYRSRCLVCEEAIRRKNERQRFGSGHKTCQNEYRRFPHVYDLPRREPLPSIGKCTDGPKSAHSTGLEIGAAGDRPSQRCLRGWSWHSDELEHELQDANGTPLARIESNAGRHRLTHPTRPQSCRGPTSARPSAMPRASL